MVAPTQGSVTINGVPVEKSTEEIGMVFQTPALLPWRTVIRNVILPIEIQGLDTEKGLEQAKKLLEIAGLKGFENSHPYELSGGMQQRVSICRSLIHDPPLLLMDEPFGALDAITRDQMNEELLRIWSITKKTVIFITHNIEEAVFLADYVIVMSACPAVVIDKVKIDLPRPRASSVKETEPFLKHATHIYSKIGTTK